MSIRCLCVPTTSPLKLLVIQKFIEFRYPSKYVIEPVNCDSLGLPAQPIGASTHLCAYARLQAVRKSYPGKDYLVIESGANLSEGFDFCTAIFERNGLLVSVDSNDVNPMWLPKIDQLYIDQIRQLPVIEMKQIQGYNQTIGQLMKEVDPTIDDKNWMKSLGIDRSDQIEATLIALDDKMTQSEKNRDEVIQSYTIHKDYPQKGVDFQDVFSVFSNGSVNAKLMDLLVAKFRYAQLDYVIGLEARGFCLGYALAYELTKLTGNSVGFLPVRKEDAKLPGHDIIRVKYTKEYGTDSFKMVNISQKGKRVVILDDLIGLGGSMWAGLQLALMQEFDVVDCCALRQVDSLQGHALKQIGRSYTILLQGN